MTPSLQFITLNLSENEHGIVEAAVEKLDANLRGRYRDINRLESIDADTSEPTIVILPLDSSNLEQVHRIPMDVIFVRGEDSQVNDREAFGYQPLSIIHNINDVDEVRFRLTEAKQECQRRQTVGDLPDERQLKDRAMSATPVGITIAEYNGKDNPLLYVNEGFEEITGYPRQEILGRDCRFLQGEDTQQDKVNTIREAIDQGTDTTVELLNYRQNGEPFWNRLSISPIRNQEGTITHFVGIQEDVTVEKEQEKRLRRTEALASIGEMAAGIMHEINNPNAIIKGNARFLIRHWDYIEETLREDVELDDQLLTVVNEFSGVFEEIETSSLRIERIVNKIKFFARRGPQGYDLDHIEPDPIVQSAVDSLNVEESVQLNVDIKNPGDFSILGDSLGLEKVVSELLNNAVEGVAGEPNPRINLRTERINDEYHITLTDNGSGIDEAIRDKIFEPFYTTKPDNDHIGLGCSIASAIVDQMDGEIEIDSDGSGTTVYLRIPLVKDR